MAAPAAAATPGSAGLWGWGRKRREISCQPEVPGGPSSTAHAVYAGPRCRRDSRGSECLQVRTIFQKLLAMHHSAVQLGRSAVLHTLRSVRCLLEGTERRPPGREGRRFSTPGLQIAGFGSKRPGSFCVPRCHAEFLAKKPKAV